MRNMKNLFILFFALSSISVFGQKHTFEYKLSKGDEFRQSLATDMWITQTNGLETLEINSVTAMDMRYKVSDANADSYTLRASFDRIRNEMDFGFDKIIFDSNTHEEIATVENLSPIFKAMTGIPFEMTINKKGEVLSIRGFEKINEVVTKLIDQNIEEELRMQMIHQIEEQFSEETLKTLFNQTASYLPAYPVATGDSWETEIPLQSGTLSMNTSIKNKFKEVKNNIAYIDSFGEISIPVTTEEIDGIEAKITMSGSNSGHLSIDMKTGLPVDFATAQTIDGETEIMGMNIPQKIVIKTSIKAIK